MSQRSSRKIDINLPLTIKVSVSELSFSNHNGFKQDQIDNAILEFKEKIITFLESEIVNEFYSEEFLDSVDFVNFKVESDK